MPRKNQVSLKPVPVEVPAKRKPGATGARSTGASPEPRQMQSVCENCGKGVKACSWGGVACREDGPLQRKREARASPKGPTSEQFTAMAGAMHNALDGLRGLHFRVKDKAAKDCGWLQPEYVEITLREIITAENILRVGLKARFRK